MQVKAGAIRFNTDSSQLEIYDGNQWTGVVSTSPEQLTGGTRGLHMGGGHPNATSTVQYINVDTTGDDTMFGDLTAGLGKLNNAGFASRTKGFVAGGRTYQTGNTDHNTIQEHEFASTGNFNDFGDLSTTRNEVMSMSNTTRGVVAGGNNPTSTNTIEYITMSSSGNAVDFGDQYELIGTCGGNISSPTRGLMCGGANASDTIVNTIQYITLSTLGNSADFGDMTTVRRFPSAGGNAVRGINAQGSTPSATNIIDYVTIATLGNAADFGDVNNTVDYLGACASFTRGVNAGGQTPTKLNTIEYVTIASTGNATDFGDLTNTRRFCAGFSDCHGGLG